MRVLLRAGAEAVFCGVLSRFVAKPASVGAVLLAVAALFAARLAAADLGAAANFAEAAEAGFFALAGATGFAAVGEAGFAAAVVAFAAAFGAARRVVVFFGAVLVFALVCTEAGLGAAFVAGLAAVDFVVVFAAAFAAGLARRLGAGFVFTAGAAAAFLGASTAASASGTVQNARCNSIMDWA